jgi:hypothetical protein
MADNVAHWAINVKAVYGPLGYIQGINESEEKWSEIPSARALIAG